MPFLADYFVTIYEGDPDCVPQIEEVNGPRGYRHSVQAAILADAAGPACLHVNYCPCTSSLLPTVDLPPDGYKFSDLLGDYVFSTSFRTVREIHAAATTLDAATGARGQGVDFLSLDTQGNESQVVAGARDQLTRNTVAVVCEVAFREVYRGQPLLGDVIRQMRDCGFEFIRLLGQNPGGFSPYRKPLGWRALGMMDFDDALFFKDIGRIRTEQQRPGLALFKAAFFALSFGHLEWALACLDAAMEIEPTLPARQASDCHYLQMLAELHELSRSAPRLSPPRFDELFSLEESFARFVERIPHHWEIYDKQAARARYFANNDPRLFQREIENLLASAPTPLEALLSRYGFGDVADLVSQKRQKQAMMTIRSLHLARRTGSGFSLDEVALKAAIKAAGDRT